MYALFDAARRRRLIRNLLTKAGIVTKWSLHYKIRQGEGFKGHMAMLFLYRQAVFSALIFIFTIQGEVCARICVYKEEEF